MAKTELVEKEDPRAGVNRFRGYQDALKFLKTEARRPENLSHFRTMWKRIDPTQKQDAVPSDRVILEDLAKRLSDGQLRTMQRKAPPGGSGGGGDAAPPPASSAPPPLSREQPMKVRPRPEPGSASPPPPVTDIAQQVRALIEAALAGSPFCEQCEKPPNQEAAQE